MINQSLSTTVLERDVLDAKRLARLLGEGLDPSAICQFGYYPLEIAALRRNIEVVRLLLEAGAQPDVSPEKTRPSNVMAYATKGNVNVSAMTEICRILVESGANPNGNDPKHGSPLHAAVKAGWFEAVRILAWLGANLEDVAVSQIRPSEVIGTPLNRARISFSESMLLLLLRLGAKDDCLSGKGLTAFQECVRMGFNQVVEYYVRERNENLLQTTCDGQTLLEVARKEPTKRLLRSLMTEANLAEAIKETSLLKFKPSKPLFSI